MHQRISKKIFIYLFIFLILASLNNVKLSKFSIPKINNLEIFGLENDENEKIYKDIEYIKNKNIFSLNKNKILNIIYKNKAVEEFFNDWKNVFRLNINLTCFHLFFTFISSDICQSLCHHRLYDKMS